jgi:Leucine-rich repeat (LRR) protein
VQNEHNQITRLSLRGCGLKELPPEIGNLQNLTSLNLERNQLSTLPPEIGNLQNLTLLILYSNQLSTLPPEIGNLQNLTRLFLDNNQLTQFPKALLDLNLEVKWDRYKRGICVEDNPFQTPPVEIVKQGRQAIIDYYAALEKQPERPLNESKRRLIGDGAAGKTSLMKRLLGLDFNPQESQTHGININTLTIKDNQNNDIKLHCWDFGGQLARQKFLLPQKLLPRNHARHPSIFSLQTLLIPTRYRQSA